MRKIVLYFLILIINPVFSFQCKKTSSPETGTENIAKDSINSFVTTIDGFDYTKLGISCKNNDLTEAKKLISAGADINIAKKDDIYEYDALSVAIENKHVQMVSYLIQNKADVNKIYTEEGLTPLGLAAKLNAKDIVEILIKNGAKVNGAKVSDTDYKETPLLIAVNSNHLSIAKILIISGANVDDTDNKGNSIKNLILAKDSDWKILLFDTAVTQKKSSELQGEYYADDSKLDEYGISIKFENGSIVYTESGNMGKTYNQYELKEDKKENNKTFLTYQKTLNGYIGDADKTKYFGIMTVVNNNQLQFESDYLKTRFGVEKTSFSK